MAFNCKLCSMNVAMGLQVADAKSGGALPISLCEHCGLVQQTNIPLEDELKVYYSHHYRQDYKNTYSPKLKHVRRAGLVAIERINFLNENLNAPRKLKLLDIGAGGGEFVYLSGKSDFNSCGIEPNKGYSDYAKEEYGIDVKAQMLDELSSGSADIVTIFHVFEHMAKPEAAMKKIAEILTDDGLLFIEVPNILTKNASPHNIFFKAHLFYYSQSSLISAASQFFAPVAIESGYNLRILFKKKKQFLSAPVFPENHDVTFTKQRISEKGWLEYLFVGKGIFKPFKKITQIITEKRIKSISPKELLDNLLI